MKYVLFATIALTAVFLTGYQVLSMDDTDKPGPAAQMSTADQQAAVFAGGCFWCTESDFEKVAGVIEAISGYTGGDEVDPTYQQVSTGQTGHVEAVKVVYDPAKIDYEGLLAVFWRSIDPTDPGGQFVDRGPQYRSAVFYADAMQRRMAQASKEKLAASDIFDEPIVTEILPLNTFYPAETYHQDYYKKNPLRYRWYRSGSGRDSFLAQTWGENPSEKWQEKVDAGERHMGTDMSSVGSTTARQYRKPDETELRRRLSNLQYNVTQKDATEPPFRNKYWDNHRQGIYVDIVSGEPLFSSTDKFDSGTGWPSFSRPLVPENIVEKTDRSHFMVRTEVRSKHADSHLGHLFKDGPPPTGLRYCINSAALRFIPKDELEDEGYGDYADLFEDVGSKMTISEEKEP